MIAPGRLVARIAPSIAISALVLACVPGLVANPDHLIVDGRRPSRDPAETIEPRPVGNDLTRLFLPHHERIARRVAAGSLPPGWDDRGFSGRPLVGNPQASLFYPPAWLAWLAWGPSVLGWVTLAHLAFAGIGVASLAARSGCRPFAATIAGGVFAASPYLIAQVFEGHYPHVWAACWSPWAFLAADDLRRGRRRGLVALPIVLALAFFAGHLQEVYYVALVLGLLAAHGAIVAWRRGDRREAPRILGRFAAAFALTVGLVGVELIPDSMAAARGRKADRMSIAEASKYHVEPIHLLQLARADALGGPADHVGPGSYWETVVSIGLIPLSLLIVGRVIPADRRVARGWSALAVGALVFAAGWKFGLFAVLYAAVPGMDRFRVPARALFLANLAAAVLVGLGVDRLRARPIPLPRWPRRPRPWVAAMIPPIVTGLALAPASRPPGAGWSPAHPWGVAASRAAGDPLAWMGLIALIGVAAWLRRRPGDHRRAAVLLGLLGWAELATVAARVVRTAPASAFVGADPIAEAIRRDGGPGPHRIRARDSLYGDWMAEVAGLEKINLGDGFQLGAAADLYERLYKLFSPDRPEFRGGHPDDPGLRARVRRGILDRLGVAYLVVDRPVADPSWTPIASGPFRGSSYFVYRNPTALPPAYVVPGVVVRPRPLRPFLETLAGVDPRSAVLMDADPLPIVGARQPYRPADVLSIEPDRPAYRVSTTAPGLLVLNRAIVPGWSATLDGRPAPILAGNHCQGVIALGAPGVHAIQLTYTPPGLRTGGWISAISVGILIVCAIGSRAGPVRGRRLIAGEFDGGIGGGSEGSRGAKWQDSRIILPTHAQT